MKRSSKCFLKVINCFMSRASKPVLCRYSETNLLSCGNRHYNDRQFVRYLYVLGVIYLNIFTQTSVNIACFHTINSFFYEHGNLSFGRVFLVFTMQNSFFV